MKRYIWETQFDRPICLIGEYERGDSPNRFDLKAGARLPDTWGRATFEFGGARGDLLKYDDLANNALVPLVSDRLAALLVRNCPDLVQLFPADIRAVDGELSGYWVLNVTCVGEAIDLEQSEYGCIAGTSHPLRFSKLVFRDTVDPRLLFRESSYRSFIVVGEPLRNEFSMYGITGVDLVSPDKFGGDTIRS